MFLFLLDCLCSPFLGIFDSFINIGNLLIEYIELFFFFSELFGKHFDFLLLDLQFFHVDLLFFLKL